MKRNSLNTFLFLLLSLLTTIFIGCATIDVFEKNTPIPNNKWSRDFAANGSFEIADTASFYNIYIVLRHTDSYNYNNIWLNVGVMSPGDSMRYQKMDLTL